MLVNKNILILQILEIFIFCFYLSPKIFKAYIYVFNAYVEMSRNAYMKWDEIKSPHLGFK